MLQWRNVPIAGICLCVVSALSSVGCDVGRSVLAPFDAGTDATVAPSDVPGDRSTDALVDARTGTRTCADFAGCAPSCTPGVGFSACVQGCARDLRPSSQALVDSVLTCFRASCDGGLDDGQCVASAGTLTRCSPQVTACMADGALTDGGIDVPVTDGGCPAGQALCGGACTPVLTNPTNCGACGVTCTASQVCSNGSCIGNGHLRFTLNWDRPGDVDLHVVPPCGTDIFFQHRSDCGGELDRDDTTGTGPENTFWRTTAPSGTYLVCVVPFANVAVPTESTVEVFIGTTLQTTLRRTLNSTGTMSTECSRTSPNFVGEFTLGGGGDGGVPTDVVTPTDAPAPTLGCEQGIACLGRCPYRDLACARSCAALMRPSSSALFNSLIDCTATACSTEFSEICATFAGATAMGACQTQGAACVMDTAGTYTPPCTNPNESLCGSACVNTLIDTAHCGRCDSACTSAEVCEFGRCVAHGHTNITLSWNSHDDVDLVVATPCGDSISARHASACAAFTLANSTGFGPENVSFATAPRAGRYSICAIPRTAVPGGGVVTARTSIFRSGMPTVTLPLVMGVNDHADRSNFLGHLITGPTTTTVDTCDPAGPYHIADIDL